MLLTCFSAFLAAISSIFSSRRRARSSSFWLRIKKQQKFSDNSEQTVHLVQAVVIYHFLSKHAPFKNAIQNTTVQYDENYRFFT